MKNLKRALSLVLSTAMLAGMMMVGTGAAFDDVTAEHNEEAIAVVSAAGIMGANEEFNPDAKITRNEMAVVMCNMLGLNTEDYTGASNFADVPAWAEGYVDACYANGIVSGVSATQYNGSANVTTGEAALMMMKALGYFQYASDFENDWLLATIKQASKIELLEDVDAGAKAAMTRNEVAQLALNTLESVVVEGYQSGTTGTIVSGDVSVNLNAEVRYNEQYNSKTYNPGNDDDGNYEYLIEKLYDEDYKKVKTNQTTDLGEPAYVWNDMTQKPGDQELIKVADAPDYVIVADDDYADVLTAYQEMVDDDYEIAIAAKDITYNTGKVAWDSKVQSGDVLEFWMDDSVITDVVGIRYEFGEVTKVTSKTLTKENKADGATAKINVDAQQNTANDVTAMLDIDFVGFDYEEDDMILYVLDAKGEKVLASQKADSIEGKVSALKGTKAKIDGEYINSEITVKVGDNGTFYLNLAGEIIGADSTSAVDDYIYIYAVDVDESGRNADGVKTTVATAYTVDAEGTKASYEMAIDNVTEKETEDLKREVGKYFADTKIAVADTYTDVVAYSINSDDQLVIEESVDEIKKVTLTADKNTAAETSSATEFIFVYTDGSSKKVATATGYKNVKIEGKTAWTITNDDEDILYVFVAGKNGSVTTDANLAVVLDAAAAQGKNDDGDKTYTYSVAIDGVESELTFKTNMGFKDGAVIAYEFDDDWAVIDSDAEYTESAVKAATDDYITVVEDGKNVQYNLTGDEVIYTIVMEYEDGIVSADTLDSVVVAEGGEIEKDDNVVYTVDDDAIETIFVYEIVY